MDELFGTDNLSKSKKKILDKEKEEKKRTNKRNKFRF